MSAQGTHDYLSQPVEGWRTWRIDKELPASDLSPRLRSVTWTDYYWTPRKAAEALCRTCIKSVPGEHCLCGLYSAKSLEHLLTMHLLIYDAIRTFPVVGRVANWGKVIEGEDGFRAQFSYPLELFVPYEVAVLSGTRLSEAYGVPVRPLDISFRETIQKHKLPLFLPLDLEKR